MGAMYCVKFGVTPVRFGNLVRLCTSRDIVVACISRSLV